MIILTLLAKLESAENVCFGPLCPQLQKGASQNSVLGLVGSTLGKAVNIMLIVAGLFMFFYLLWGALDWVMSEGDKEKLSKAQKKIQNAVIGLFVMVIAISLFGVITGDILGIIVQTPGGGWTIKVPNLAE
jgi:hypothetical protein